MPTTGAAARPGPAQQRGDPGRQVLAGERLDQVVVGAVVEQPDDLRLLVPGGRDDDRRRGDRAHHLQRLAAVQVGEAEVKDDHVGRIVADLPDPVERGARRAHGVRPLGEVGGHRRADIRVILDNEHTGHVPNRTYAGRFVRHYCRHGADHGRPRGLGGRNRHRGRHHLVRRERGDQERRRGARHAGDQRGGPAPGPAAVSPGRRPGRRRRRASAPATRAARAVRLRGTPPAASPPVRRRRPRRVALGRRRPRRPGACAPTRWPAAASRWR